MLQRARFSVSAGFFLFAAVMGSWAPRLPAVKERLALSNGDLGLALLGLAVGFVVATRIAPALIHRFTSAPVLRASTAGLCLSLVGPAVAGDLVALTLALGAMGIAGGLCDVAVNAQAVVVERTWGRPLMSGFHALWSLGAMLAGGTAAGAARAGMSTTLHFSIAAVFLLAASGASLRWLVPRADEHDRAERERRDAPDLSAASAAVLLLGLIAFASFIAEGSVADWSAVYLREGLGAAPAAAALAFTAFSGAMALCRLLSGALVMRLGPILVARAGGLLAAAGLSFALVVRSVPAAIAGFTVLGVGLAPIVPLAFSAAGNTGPRSSSTILGRVVMMGYLGSIVGPVVIGFAADRIGLRGALFFPVALACLAALCAPRVRAVDVVLTEPAGARAPEKMTWR
ncbi:MAG: MFS transporter [Actinomycetota bacterium]